MAVPQLMVISGSQKMWGFELLFLKIFAPRKHELTKYPSSASQKKIPSACCQFRVLLNNSQQKTCRKSCH